MKRFRNDPFLVRQVDRGPSNPNRITIGRFNGRECRVLRWQHKGVRYALGYDHRRLFGEKLRRRREQLMLSMQITMHRVMERTCET